MKGLIIAFAMYSKIPMPRTEWNESNMKYALGFFPLVGVVIGGLYYMSCRLLEHFLAGNLLKAACLTILPILISGGIHMDGWIDVIDARHSYAERERKLEILKDPHIGAFAVIYTAVYLILLFGLNGEMTVKTAAVTACGFVCSRAFSGMLAVTLVNARKSGMLKSVTKDASRTVVKGMNLSAALLAMAAAVCLDPMSGGMAIVLGVLVMIDYCYMAKKEFGGVTGDLAGYFLQKFELAWIGGIVIVNIIFR